jgi:hypothetical protein
MGYPVDGLRSSREQYKDGGACFPLQQLPCEILLRIFQLLQPNAQDIASLALTCRECFQIGTGDELWQSLCESECGKDSRAQEFFFNLYCSSMQQSSRAGQLQSEINSVADDPRYRVFHLIWKRRRWKIVKKQASTPSDFIALSLRDNALTFFPGFEPLSGKVHRIDLSGNKIPVDRVILALKRLGPHLQIVKLSHCGILTLPNAIRDLTSVTELDLSHNQITEIPLALMSLTSLQNLDLSHNEISHLPSQIRNLTALERLNLKGNEIPNLPRSLDKKKREGLNIELDPPAKGSRARRGRGSSPDLN